MVYKPTYIWGAPSCITEFNSANNGIQLVNDNQFKGNMLILGTMTCFFVWVGGRVYEKRISTWLQYYYLEI